MKIRQQRCQMVFSFLQNALTTKQKRHQKGVDFKYTKTI